MIIIQSNKLILVVIFLAFSVSAHAQVGQFFRKLGDAIDNVTTPSDSNKKTQTQNKISDVQPTAETTFTAGSSKDTNLNKNLSLENHIKKLAEKFLMDLPKSSVFAIKLMYPKSLNLDESSISQIEASISSAVQSIPGRDARVVPRTAIKTILAEKRIADDPQSLNIDNFLGKITADYLLIVNVRPHNSNSARVSTQIASIRADREGEFVFNSGMTEVELKLDGNYMVEQESYKKDMNVTIDLLKKISSEIGDLKNRDGLIDNPKTYSGFYHNARVLSQRGEIDLALSNYEKIFKTPIQFADPLIDLTTLLTRMHGKTGAKAILEQKFKPILQQESYLYAAQLLSEKPLKEITNLYLKDKKKFFSFPPLSALYIKKQYEESKDNFDDMRFKIYTFSWLDWVFYTEITENIKTEIDNGTYLAYFIDQLRGNADSENLRIIASEFNANSVLKTTLPLYKNKENKTDPKVKLYSSPIAIDYGTSEIFIWDKSLDHKKPIKLCAGTGSAERCVDINNNLKCNSGLESTDVDQKCLLFEPWVKVARGSFGDVVGGVPLIPKKGWAPPFVKINLSINEILKTKCISRFEYSTEDGKKVNISEQQINAVTRVPEAQNQSHSCKYDYQN
jgi:hypothetical protein